MTGPGPEPIDERALGLPRGFRDRLLTIPDAGRLFALLFGLGASFGMFAWSASSDGMVHYAVQNEASVAARQLLLQIMLWCGAGACLAGFAFLLLAKREPAARLQRLARRLSPLLLIGLVPLLFNWKPWVSRELTLGVLVCIVGFVLHTCLTVASDAGPADPDSAFAALSRMGQRLMARTERWAPPVIVGVAALGYTLYFSYYTIAYHRSVLTMSYDLGLENNLVWNLVHGGQFMKSAPLVGPVGSHFGYHATFFAYVLAIPYVFHQDPETLLVIQAALLGGAAIPLYLFARSRIGRWSAALVAVMYVLYPPLHGSNLYDFHYLPLGVFFLWLTLWLIDSGRYFWGALAVLLTLSVREDVAADLAVMGGYMLFAGRRPRAGLVVGIVATIYFLVLKMMVMPRFLQGSESFLHQWQGLVPKGGRGYSGVLATVVGNPAFTLTSLLETDKFLYLVQIGAPLCFFAWRRPIGFFVSLPGFLFTLLSTKYPPLVQISFQYTAHWTAFLFVAFVSCLEWIRQPKSAGDDAGWKRQRVWLATACFTTLVTSYQYGAILQQNTARGGFGKYKFVTTPQDVKRYNDLKALIAMVPPDAKITSSEFVVPHVSSRADAYTLRNGIYDAEYLLFEEPLRDDEKGFVRDALKGAFGVVAVRGPFVLAKRGHDTAENAPFLKKLR
jgi:uncharacterized membrane protein